MRWLANSGQGRSHYPNNFWSSYKCLLHYQIALEWLLYFEHGVQSLLNNVLSGVHS